MAGTVVTTIGSGLIPFRFQWPNKKNNIADLVAVANWEDSNAFFAASGSTVIVTSGTGTQLPAIPLAMRRSISITNTGGGLVFIGGSGVGIADGYPIYPTGTMTLQVAPTVQLWAIASGVSSQLRLLELA